MRVGDRGVSLVMTGHLSNGSYRASLLFTQQPQKCCVMKKNLKIFEKSFDDRDFFYYL